MENENDLQFEQCEHVEHGIQCEQRAAYICDTCDAMLCNDHVVILHITCMDDMSPRCRDTTCEHERTVADVSQYVNVYRACYVGNGICVPYNRECLYRWLGDLDLTDEQINTFCDEHDI